MNFRKVQHTFFFFFLLSDSILISAARDNSSCPPAIKITASEIERDEEFTDKVIIRLYFIARMQSPVTVLKKLIPQNIPTINQSDLIKNYFTLNRDDIKHFQHATIMECIEHINKNRNLDSLFALWNRLKAYRDLDDMLLMEEFTKLGIVIFKNIILGRTDQSVDLTNQKKRDQLLNEYRKIFSMNFEQLTDTMDHFTHCYQRLINKTSNLAPCNLPMRFENDLRSTIHPPHIIKRFYHLNRLAKAFALLEPFKHISLNALPLKPKIKKNFLHFLPHLPISHTLVKDCMHKMTTHKTLQPLLLLWQSMKEYKAVEDEKFMRDFIIVVTSLYKNLLVTAAHEHDDKEISLDEISEIYQNLSSLPILEMLDALDILVDKFEQIMDRYEPVAHGKSSFREWLRAQWWTPPLIAAIALIYIIRTTK